MLGLILDVGNNFDKPLPPAHYNRSHIGTTITGGWTHPIQQPFHLRPSSWTFPDLHWHSGADYVP